MIEGFGDRYVYSVSMESMRGVGLELREKSDFKDLLAFSTSKILSSRVKVESRA